MSLTTNMNWPPKQSSTLGEKNLLMIATVAERAQQDMLTFVFFNHDHKGLATGNIIPSHMPNLIAEGNVPVFALSCANKESLDFFIEFLTKSRDQHFRPKHISGREYAT